MAKVMVLLYKSKYLRRGRFAPPRLRAEVALRFRSGRASAQTFLFFGIYRGGEGMHYERTIAMTGRGFG